MCKIHTTFPPFNEVKEDVKQSLISNLYLEQLLVILTKVCFFKTITPFLYLT